MLAGLAHGAPAASAVALIGALLAFPTASVAYAVVVVLVAVLVLVLPIVHFARPALMRSGPRRAELMARAHPTLADRLQSAATLRTGPQRGISEALIGAHQSAVAAALHTFPRRDALPLRDALSRRAGAVALVAIAAIAAIGASSGRVRGGLFALAHPGMTGPTHAPLAQIIDELAVRMRYPAYVRRAETDRDGVGDQPTLRDPRRIAAPTGTVLELVVTPRGTFRAARASLGDRTIALRRRKDGRFGGQLLVRASGPLAIAMQDEGDGWLTDATDRQVVAVADAPPEVSLTGPPEGASVELDTPLRLEYAARDDHGLAEIYLVITLPDGTTVRQRKRAIVDRNPTRLAGAMEFVPAAHGLDAGDPFALRVEATDNDAVDGPKIGRSFELNLTVASLATRRAEALTALAAVLDLGLMALADRLERPLAASDPAGRLAAIRGSTDAFGEGLVALATRDGHTMPTDVLTAMARRQRQGMAREARIIAGGGAGPAEHARLAEALIDTLESDVLWLSARLEKAQIDDAAALAREIDALRFDMLELLRDLRSTNDPQVRQALVRAIARARQQLDALRDRLQGMAHEVPEEFVNAEALAAQVTAGETGEALDRIQAALDDGDLDRAERELLSLGQEIDALAQALGQGADSFREAEMGPRERALADAMDRLMGLEAEQGQLARRSSEIERQTAARALAASPGAAGDDGALAAEAGRLRERVEHFQRGRRPPSHDPDDFAAPDETESSARMAQRLRDTADALGTADLAEALRMSAEAEADADALAREFEMSALMFPGAHSETASAARETRAMAAAASALRRSIQAAIPDLDQHLGDGARQAMSRDRGQQQAVREATGDLHRRLANDPDGAPLAPTASQAVEAAGAAMERAAGALGAADASAAAAAQAQAEQRLAEARRAIEQQAERGQGRGDDDHGHGNAGPRPPPVRIHGAEEFQGPQALRRRLLDAMREPSVDGYDDAVRSYYEGLLQ